MTDEENDKTSIETLLKSYETALNAGDANAIMDLLVENPIFIQQNAQPVIGRDLFRKTTEQTFKTIKFDEHFTLHEVEISGDQAWARTSASVKIRNLASGKETVGGGNQLWVFTREDGGWKVRSYMAAASSPPPAS
jgi:uncharacterized protein (TIGR02246 family)